LTLQLPRVDAKDHQVLAPAVETVEHAGQLVLHAAMDESLILQGGHFIETALLGTLPIRNDGYVIDVRHIGI
jgi:hypothetical protein